MSELLGQVLIVGALAALALLVGYQVYMLWWTRKTSGSIPLAVLVLRVTNIVLLVVGGALVIVRVMN